MFIGMCSSCEVTCASSSTFLVNGSKSSVRSVGSVFIGVIALTMACVCRCGIVMGVLCNDEGAMGACSVDSASMMGMFAVCIKKCVDTVLLHGILVFGRYRPSNCRWHRHGTPTIEYAMAFLSIGVLCWQIT